MREFKELYEDVTTKPLDHRLKRKQEALTRELEGESREKQMHDRELSARKLLY